jgi:hypothetical protein
MARLKLSTLGVTALVLLGTASIAHAQQPAQVKAKPQGSASYSATPTTQPQDPMAPPGMRKTLQWDDKTGRWGLALNLDQSASREARLKEAEVGAYYRVTPSLRVGGALGVTNTPNPRQPVETDPNQPRLRIESALKF